MTEADIAADPFHERGPRARRRHFRVLGGRFEFESDSAELLKIVESAYARLPIHTWGRAEMRCRVTLAVTPPTRAHARGEPKSPELFAAGRTLCAVTDEPTFVTVTPENRSALVAVSSRLLNFPYHLRYEHIELAVYLLAARCRGLIPLHAACLSLADRGVLVTGPSGSGKSTLALQWLAEGLDFVSEDSVLVDPGSLHATGLPNFLHLRADSLRFLDQARLRAAVLSSPVIRRRSGISKFEIDLRSGGWRLAAHAPRLAAIVFASPKRGTGGALLAPLPHKEAARRLRESQPYAARQPGWKRFAQSLARIGAYELLRGRHPSEASSALRGLLMNGKA